MNQVLIPFCPQMYCARLRPAKRRGWRGVRGGGDNRISRCYRRSTIGANFFFACYRLGVMQLRLQNERIGNVAVLRCEGRIVTGDEAQALAIEVEKLTLDTHQVVLNLAQVNFLDSGGLGALVRMTRVHRRHSGDIVLCHLTPFILGVLEATTLHRFFQICPSETEALQSFSLRAPVSSAATPEPLARVVCAHNSTDLLAFISAVLRHAGFEVFTATTLAEARTLVVATHPNVFVHGSETDSNELSLERIRQIDPQRPFLQLPADFSCSEASQTGAQLVNRIRSLVRA